VAVIISYQALLTSQRTLKVANRAYVVLTDGSLQFSDYGTVTQEGSQGHLIVRKDLSAAIRNAGNTPAEAGTFKPIYRLPEGWSEAPAQWKKRLGPAEIGVIGPQSTVPWHYTDLFELTPEIYHAFRSFPGKRFIYMDAKFDYRDVFGETSTVRWCWVAATNERSTATTACDGAQQLILLKP
jgi:hypothetical protein